MADPLTRIAFFFPVRTYTSFLIVTNLVINDTASCPKDVQNLVVAIMVFFCIICFVTCFTDTYTASNNAKCMVFMLPVYGAMCFNLPTDDDKDRVYEYFYVHVRDYVLAFTSTICFILITLFTNPVSACLFPSGASDGTSKFDASVVRTVPVLVSIVCCLVFALLGNPRQMIGCVNVPETAPLIERPMADNPIYGDGAYPQENSVIDEGDEEAGYDDIDAPGQKDVSPGSMSRMPRESSRITTRASMGIKDDFGSGRIPVQARQTRPSE